MSEAGRSMIDGMMGRLGETAGLLAGDQTRGTVIPSGPKGVNSRIPLVVADPSPEGGSRRG
jgi:hypothetical protein